MIKKNKIQTLIENYESSNSPADISFKEYLERESKNNPSFFSFLFEEDFDTSLTDEQSEVFEDFLETEHLTYDLIFDSDTSSNDEGFKSSFQYCLDYIKMNNGTNWGYFKDYKGGCVSIVCNETGTTVYQEEVR
uniref:Phage protein n=1 Tax=Prevotella sp. GTC17254 TaxID=3236794 RepID=A0AB33J393_9BACT